MSAIPLDNTAGAVYVGNLVAAVLYGITNVQVYIFLRGARKGESGLRWIILFLWILDTLQLALVCHGVYSYAISNFGSYLNLLRPVWSVMAQVLVTSVSDFIVRFLFGWRVWRLSGGNKPLAFLIGTTSCAVFGIAIAFYVRSMKIVTFVELKDFSYLLYLALGGIVVSDAIVAISLCYLLARSRNGIKSTDSLVHTLMMYSINTGLLTSITAVACFISYAVMPNNFVFMAFYFGLSKLYFNALLATLNARNSLRSQRAAVTLPLSSRQGLTSRTTGELSQPYPQLTVSIQRITDIKREDSAALDDSMAYEMPIHHSPTYTHSNSHSRSPGYSNGYF